METTRIIITNVMILCAFAAEAQNITGNVCGIVDNGTSEVLPGAYVIWDGTSRGTITDKDGDYELQPIEGGESHNLVVSYVGYRTDSVAIDSVGTYNFLLKPLTIEGVYVSARRAGSMIDRKSAMLTERITADELCKAACCNLGESFQTNASVDVNYADATTGAKTIQLLGLQGRYVQMMSENVPSLRGIASSFGLTYVPGPWMNGIQISKGAGTVVNGYEAITGQINIDYNKPVGTDEVFSVNLFGSSGGRIEANAQGNIKMGSAVRTMLMINAAEDLRDMDENNDGFRDEPRTKQISVFNRWYKHDDIHTLDVVIKTLNEKRVSGETLFDSDKPDADHYGVYINTDRIETWMKNGFVFSDNVNIGFPVGYTYHYQNSFFGNRSYVGTQHSYNINSILNIRIGDWHEFHTGVSTQGDIYDEKTDYGEGIEESNHDDVSVGIYGQYTLKVDDYLSVVAGIRADRHNNYHTLVTPRLHLRLSPTEHTIIRLAAGKGYRAASIFAENNYMLTNKRKWHIEENYGYEAGWNMGANITQYIHLGDKELMLNAEYYRTEFERQMVIDLDYGPRDIYASYSEERAYADNIQVEGKISPIRGLDVTTAWRWNNNRLYLGGEKRRRPLVSRYKGLVAVSYQTPLKTWQFDANMQVNGGGRIPTTEGNPVNMQRPESFGSYRMFNAQITKWFRTWSIYAGCENIGNFTQKDPIISADDPQSIYFDSSLIWGPLMTRKFHIGLRWHLNIISEE